VPVVLWIVRLASRPEEGNEEEETDLISASANADILNQI